MDAPDPVALALQQMLDRLAPIGRHAETGGYRRFAWTEADLACREWFRHEAELRQMPLETDRNGNLWAYHPAPPAAGESFIATGSHLDSVPDGGAYDGPLGVVSGFAAVDLLRAEGRALELPLAVAVFADEEGARFGVACVGSRLLTGVLDPGRARSLTDADGTTMGEALAAAGLDPDGLGRDSERLGRLAAYVELHVEQGRALDLVGAPLGLATEIWPHGRWRLELRGEANHAGTTRLEDRHDPMLPLAEVIVAARQSAGDEGGLATVGRVAVAPNATNAVPSAVLAWLDARAPSEEALDHIVAAVDAAADAAAGRHSVSAELREESRAPAVTFDEGLRQRLDGALGGVPAIPTGAGHDAGVLASEVPTAMLFVRNRTGVSHSPDEHADLADCAAGVRALAAVLLNLVGRGASH